MARPAESIVHGSKATPKDLPSIDRLLQRQAVHALVDEHGHTLVAAEARKLIDGLRVRALAGALSHAEVEPPALDAQLADRVQQRLAPRLRRVINLTGTVIHTNLGRALLAEPALQHLLAMMAGPNNLEYDLASRRPRRPRQRGRGVADHADRRAGRHRGEQQRSRGAADDRRAWRAARR